MNRLLIHSPIDALGPLVTAAFENPNGSLVAELRDAVANGLVVPDFELDSATATPEGPSVKLGLNGKGAQIRLQTAYLEHLWSFIYSWLVIYEEGVQKPLLAGAYSGELRYDTPLKQRAEALRRWGDSLRDTYTPWPAELPSPSSTEGDEAGYAKAASQIYVMAVAYLLHHEFAHIKQRHFEFLARPLTEDERASRRALEREADDVAFSALVSQIDGEQVRRLKGWAVLAPPLAWLSLVHSSRGLFPATHPIAHHRIYESLSRLDYFTEENRFYFYYLCSVVLGSASARLSGKHHAQRTFETAEEALQSVMDELDLLAPSR